MLLLGVVFVLYYCIYSEQGKTFLFGFLLLYLAFLCHRPPAACWVNSAAAAKLRDEVVFNRETLKQEAASVVPSFKKKKKKTFLTSSSQHGGMYLPPQKHIGVCVCVCV